MELKYILFDMDGVILDSRDSILEAMRYTLKQYGRELSAADEKRIIGPPLLKIYTGIFGFDPDTAREAMTVYRNYYNDTSYRFAKAYDGVEDMLKELLAHDRKLMLATARGKDIAEFMLKYIGVRDCFCYIGGVDVYAEPGGNAVTDKTGVIRNVLLENSIRDPERAVMVGDRREDIEGGKANGLHTIGSLYGFGSEEELKDADHLVTSPMAISHYIIENY